MPYEVTPATRFEQAVAGILADPANREEKALMGQLADPANRLEALVNARASGGGGISVRTATLSLSEVSDVEELVFEGALSDGVFVLIATSATQPVVGTPRLLFLYARISGSSVTETAQARYVKQTANTYTWDGPATFTISVNDYDERFGIEIESGELTARLNGTYNAYYIGG